MKIAEFRGKDDAELALDLRNLRKELFDMRFKGAAEQNAKPARMGQIRRDIARILTVLGERSRQGAGVGEKGAR
jgi:large subunit ribosomal protein L29